MTCECCSAPRRQASSTARSSCSAPWVGTMMRRMPLTLLRAWATSRATGAGTRNIQSRSPPINRPKRKASMIPSGWRTGALLRAPDTLPDLLSGQNQAAHSEPQEGNAQDRDHQWKAPLQEPSDEHGPEHTIEYTADHLKPVAPGHVEGIHHSPFRSRRDMPSLQDLTADERESVRHARWGLWPDTVSLR